MKKLAFIAHPIDLNHIYKLAGFLGPVLRKVSPYTLTEWLIKLPPYKYNELKFKSITGAEAKGYGIVLPLLPQQVVSLGEAEVIKRVILAAKLAEKMGADLVALGGFTSVVGNEGEEVAKKVRIAVTSGNTYTAYLALKGIEVACKKMGIDLCKSVITVVGATGDIGSGCTKILCKKAKKIFLIARNRNNLLQFAKVLSNSTSAEIIVPADIDSALIESDIILTATSAITSVIDPQKLKPGAIVCDVAIPANIPKEITKLRNDILVFEGGLTSIPFGEKLNNKQFDRAMPSQNCVYGCLAEAMILTLDGKLENYSIGRGNITEEKINEIGMLGEKHGFGLPQFFCGSKVYTDIEIETVKRNALRSKISNG